MSLKKIGFFIIIIVSVLIINNLVNSTYTLWQKKHLVEKTRLELESEKEKNKMLKKKLAQVNRQQFIEEEARNKLFLAKLGEQVIVIPEKYLQATPSSRPQPKDTRPNWKKWWDVFF